jgi:hypothetical protein
MSALSHAVIFHLFLEVVDIEVLDIISDFRYILMGARMALLFRGMDPFLDRARFRLAVGLDSGNPFVWVSEVFVNVDTDIFCLENCLRCYIIGKGRGKFFGFAASEIEGLGQGFVRETRHLQAE